MSRAIIALLALARGAAAEEPTLDAKRFRVGVEAMVTWGFSSGTQLGVTGDVRIRDPLSVRARIGYGRLGLDIEQPDPSETATILRFELGAELRKDHGTLAMFAGAHGGVQRMSGGWLRMNDLGVPWAALVGGQAGIETGNRDVRVRLGLDVSRWIFESAAETDVSALVEAAYAF